MPEGSQTMSYGGLPSMIKLVCFSKIFVRCQVLTGDRNSVLHLLLLQFMGKQSGEEAQLKAIRCGHLQSRPLSSACPLRRQPHLAHQCSFPLLGAPLHMYVEFYLGYVCNLFTCVSYQGCRSPIPVSLPSRGEQRQDTGNLVVLKQAASCEGDGSSRHT